MTLKCSKFIFSQHAVFRMFERKIKKNDVLDIIRKGIVVENYADDTPYPSQLLLGFVGEEPLHLVVAFNTNERICIVVTVYVPSTKIWKNNYKNRRK